MNPEIFKLEHMSIDDGDYRFTFMRGNGTDTIDVFTQDKTGGPPRADNLSFDQIKQRFPEFYGPIIGYMRQLRLRRKLDSFI